MIITELIIALIMWFNYIIKKDLYMSVIIGITLTFINLIAIKGFSINVLSYQSSFNYYFISLVYILFIIVMRYINYSLRATEVKNQIIEIFNFWIKDTNLKILTIVFLSIIFCNTPFVGLVLLIFIATFMNFSRYNMVLIPIIFININYLLFNYLKIQSIEMINIKYLLVIILIYYIIMYLNYIYENNKVKDNIMNHFQQNIIDLIYTILLFIFNCIALLILINILPIYGSIMLSVFLTLIFGRLLISKIPILVNEDQKLESEINLQRLTIFNKIKTPYFFVVSLFIVELILYILIIKYYIIGILIFSFINYIAVMYVMKKNKFNYFRNNIGEISKFIFFILLFTLVFILIKNNINYSNDINILHKILDSYNKTGQLVLDTILNVQNYIAYVLFDSNISSQMLTINDIYSKSLILKVYYLIKIQFLFGIFYFYIIDFIFVLDKKESYFTAVSITLIGIILQILLIMV